MFAKKRSSDATTLSNLIAHGQYYLIDGKLKEYTKDNIPDGFKEVIHADPVCPDDCPYKATCAGPADNICPMGRISVRDEKFTETDDSFIIGYSFQDIADADAGSIADSITTKEMAECTTDRKRNAMLKKLSEFVMKSKSIIAFFVLCGFMFTTSAVDVTLTENQDVEDTTKVLTTSATNSALKLQAEIDDLETIRSNASSAKTKTETLDKDITALETRASSLESAASGFTNNINTLKNRTTTLESAAAGFTNDISSLESTDTTISTKIAALEASKLSALTNSVGKGSITINDGYLQANRFILNYNTSGTYTGSPLYAFYDLATYPFFMTEYDNKTYKWFLSNPSTSSTKDNSNTLATLSDVKTYGVGDVETTGSGNVVTSVSKDSFSNKITATKGITALDTTTAANTYLSKTDASSTYQAKGSYATQTDLNSVKSSVTQNTSDIDDFDKKLDTWESFVSGSNVVFCITNYQSNAYSDQVAKFKILELTEDNGTNYYREVYNSHDDINVHIIGFKRDVIDPVLTNIVNSKADKAWGKYSSSGSDLENLGISNTVYMTAAKTVFAGGLEFERVVVGQGTIGVLSTKGAAAYTQGTSGTFKIQDATSDNYFGYSKTDDYIIGCNTDDITVNNDMVTLRYDLISSTYPIIYYMASLQNYDPTKWEQLNDSDGNTISGASHTVVFDVSTPETFYVSINCSAEEGGFFMAKCQVSGNAVFETNMKAKFTDGILCTDDIHRVKIDYNSGSPKLILVTE